MGFMREFLGLLFIGFVIFGLFVIYKFGYLLLHLNAPWEPYTPKKWLPFALAWLIPALVVVAILILVFVIAPSLIRREE